jgi:hypothetical protein
MKRLHVVVDGSLPAGAQLAQAGHAVALFALEHRALFEGWMSPEHRNIVVLRAAGPLEVSQLGLDLQALGHPTSEVREPDLGGRLTAVASSGYLPGMSSLPLALKHRPCACGGLPEDRPAP